MCSPLLAVDIDLKNAVYKVTHHSNSSWSPLSWRTYGKSGIGAEEKPGCNITCAGCASDRSFTTSGFCRMGTADLGNTRAAPEVEQASLSTSYGHGGARELERRSQNWRGVVPGRT